MNNFIKPAYYIFCLLLAISVSQCKEQNGDGKQTATGQQERDSNERSLASATGTEFTYLIVVDDELNTPEFRQSLSEILHDPFSGLVSKESSLKPSFLTADAFSGLQKRQANLLFLSSRANDDAMGVMLEVFSQESVAEAMEGRGILTDKNLWARPQQLAYIPAQNENEILETLRQNKRLLLNMFDRNERQRVYSIIYPERGQNEKTEQLRSALGVQLKIPAIYRVAKELSDQEEEDKLLQTGLKTFFWIRNDTRNVANNILVYTQDYTSEEQLTQSYIINLRNKVGEAFVPGPTDTSYMQTEPIIEPAMSRSTLNDLPVVINRGHWRVEGDFMGGPFTNFTLLDEKNNRVITLDGFVYAPDQAKLPFIKRLEIIFSTLKVE
ncbi:MAG: DUF4837 family protein [Bacteroidia bacterium]